MKQYYTQMEAAKMGIITPEMRIVAEKEYLTPEARGAYWSKTIGNCAVYLTRYRDGAFTVPVEWQGGAD